MRAEQIETITKTIGIIDASNLLGKLESLGVGEDVEITEGAISIPKSIVKDLATLQ